MLSMPSTSLSSRCWVGRRAMQRYRRLKSATADLASGTGDEQLDQVLSEIELRLEVEIAKLGPPR